jgi:hypothetical protein
LVNVVVSIRIRNTFALKFMCPKCVNSPSSLARVAFIKEKIIQAFEHDFVWRYHGDSFMTLSTSILFVLPLF